MRCLSATVGVNAALDWDGADLGSLKQEDHYHFSIPFEYIRTNHGNDNYDIATACMEVDVDWDDSVGGYGVCYYCPDESHIDQSQGDSDIDGFFEYGVSDALREMLEDEGIGGETMSF